MIIRGSLERLVPVMMTALVAGLALIPLTLDAQAPGKEILYPVATVILGGLISSTLLDIIVTPVVFYKFVSVNGDILITTHGAAWTVIDNISVLVRYIGVAVAICIYKIEFPIEVAVVLTIAGVCKQITYRVSWGVKTCWSLTTVFEYQKCRIRTCKGL